MAGWPAAYWPKTDKSVFPVRLEGGIPVYEFAQSVAYFSLSLRDYGLSRRFAPRNDMQKTGSVSA